MSDEKPVLPWLSDEEAALMSPTVARVLQAVEQRHGVKVAKDKFNQLRGSTQRMRAQKAYLGDGVYVARDGEGLVLTTENGILTTNTIYLEPQVLQTFEKYVAGLREETND